MMMMERIGASKMAKPDDGERHLRDEIEIFRYIWAKIGEVICTWTWLG